MAEGSLSSKGSLSGFSLIALVLSPPSSAWDYRQSGFKMKKTLAFFCALLSVLFASSAFAKPVVETYRDKAFPLSSIKTVLVMPVGYEISIPESESFLVESAEAKWEEFTLHRKTPFPFVLRTPQEVIERASFITGEKYDAATPVALAHKAYTLAPDHVDAVLLCTVTKCEVGIIHHPEQYVTKYRYEERPVWRNDRWETQQVQIPYQEYEPAWDEYASVGAVKVELRAAKDGHLIFGETVSATTGSGLFSGAPSLTKHIQNVIENAAKRIPVK